MNRNSTAGSSGFDNRNKRGSEASSVVPNVHLRDPSFSNTNIGKTRPLSGKIPSGAQAHVNQKFQQKR